MDGWTDGQCLCLSNVPSIISLIQQFFFLNVDQLLSNSPCPFNRLSVCTDNGENDFISFLKNKDFLEDLSDQGKNP